MLNGGLLPTVDHDDDRIRLALLEQTVVQLGQRVADLDAKMDGLIKLAQQARGAGIALSIIVAIVGGLPRLLDVVRAMPAPVVAAPPAHS